MSIVNQGGLLFSLDNIICIRPLYMTTNQQPGERHWQRGRHHRGSPRRALIAARGLARRHRLHARAHPRLHRSRAQGTTITDVRFGNG